MISETLLNLLNYNKVYLQNVQLLKSKIEIIDMKQNLLVWQFFPVVPRGHLQI